MAVDLQEQPEPIPQSPDLALEGLRVAILLAEREAAEAWASMLEDHGASACVIDRGGDLRDVAALDPQVLLLSSAQLDDTSRTRLQQMQRDPRLRWATAIELPTGGSNVTAPSLATLVPTLLAAIEPHRRVATEARTGRRFRADAEIETIGPAQLVRALRESRRSLEVRVRHPHVQLELVLSGGRVLDARGVCQDRGVEEIEGAEALALLCALRRGRVEVRPLVGFARPVASPPLTLDPYRLLTPSVLPSTAPAQLVSAIPPPPRLPSRAGREYEPTVPTPWWIGLALLGGAALGYALWF